MEMAETYRISNLLAGPQRARVEQPVGDFQLPFGASHGVEGQQSCLGGGRCDVWGGGC